MSKKRFLPLMPIDPMTRYEYSTAFPNQKVKEG